MVTALPVPLAGSVVVAPFLAFLEAAGLSPHLFEGQDALVPLYGALHFADVAARGASLPFLGHSPCSPGTRVG